MNTDHTKGNIFDIQHFSVSDGPGIRTTVFLKGCPLRCAWCHNPESYLPDRQIMYYPSNCTGCSLCAAACPCECHSFADRGHQFDRSQCIRCGKCVEKCMYGGLETVGKTASVDEILDEVMEDAFFYESSGGGLTISGGEPMFQPDFAINIAKAAKKEGIHVCLETSGFCNPHKLTEIQPYTDLFLFDYKLTEKEKHKKYTGVENDLILLNLYMLDSLSAKVVLRCPMIPGVNIDKEHIAGIISVAERLQNLVEVHLEPYHNIGISKRESLGMQESVRMITPPARDSLQEIAKEIQAKVPCLVL